MYLYTYYISTYILQHHLLINKNNIIQRKVNNYFEKKDAWLTRSVRHVILNLKVLSSNPILGIEITLKKGF